MNPDLDKLPALKNLSDDVRQKALEFADALGARGPRPTTVLGTAVTLAQEWKSGRLPIKLGGPAVLVQPRNGRWIIRRADSEHATHTFGVREDAVRRAQEVARRYGTACLVFGPGGTLIERYEAPGTTTPTAVPDMPPAVAETTAVQAIAPLEVVAPVAKVTPLIPIRMPTPRGLPRPVPAEPTVAVLETEAVVEAIAVAAPEPVEAVVEAIAAPEPEAVEVAVALDPEAEPIRVKKLAHKWTVFLGDGRSESFPTRAKAQKRAKDLGQALGRKVILA